MGKIFTKNQLEQELKKIRKYKKIVLCHGVFDVVHYGHIKHFEAAKKFGDFLIVSITRDKFIKKSIKGTAFNENQRLEFLSKLTFIDVVILNDEESSEDIIKLIKPNYYIKGSDYKNNKLDDTKKIYKEKKLVKKYGGKIEYTNELSFSSSKIINNNNYLYSNTQRIHLERVKKKLDFGQVKNLIEKKNKITVSVIGELIFDIYNFGNVVGKSGKEPHLVMTKENKEILIGGSAAIAKNISSFVNKVNLISPFGYEKNYIDILDKQLPKNIKKIFNKPYESFGSIEKSRFVDQSSNYKLFGYYNLPTQSDLNFDKSYLIKVKKILNESDLLIIADYGHNFLVGNILDIVNKTRTFKTLNSQINATSKGFSNLNKYNGINTIIINETELRQELKDQTGEVNTLGHRLIKNRNCKNLIVTSGHQGAKLFKKNVKNTFSCPAFSDYSVDKIGAGDAMLSIASYSMCARFDSDLTLLLGSIAAALTVKSIGNKAEIDKQVLLRTIKYMLK